MMTGQVLLMGFGVLLKLFDLMLLRVTLVLAVEVYWQLLHLMVPSPSVDQSLCLVEVVVAFEPELADWPHVLEQQLGLQRSFDRFLW